MSQREKQINREKLLAIRMSPKSQKHFSDLHNFACSYARYLKLFNDIDKYYELSPKYGKKEFFILLRPLNEKINLCFDSYVQCIPIRYMTKGIVECQRNIFSGKGFRVSKDFYSAIRELGLALEKFKVSHKLINFNSLLREVLTELGDEVEYLIFWVLHDKDIPTRICDKYGNFISPRLSTNRDIFERREWLKYYERHKINYGKYPTYTDMTERKEIYNKKLKKWEVKPAYLPAFSRRSHTRYKKELRSGRLLNLY